ncbi:MAG: transposase [Candidatus Magnetoglobus multicellularis str. Araruama]|uniref:Transposase n=1 Tax=Candidatus Magnetoglobus multicellularis str. Araruama TaxID=890399 RepID=A0A1V1NYS0_9BACT|nr:MAG: transposase [Candidatus Magnetoglobus multicellularis str. Araruama]
MSLDQRKLLIEAKEHNMSIRKRCQLLEVNRSSFYHQKATESKFNLKIMNEIDILYTKYPFYGSRRITAELVKKGFVVNIKRVKRLMKKMGIRAIFPEPKTSLDANEHKIYPYLLNDFDIVSPNQVWSTDITYIRLKKGFVYLVAIIDWFSRFVLAWKLSNSLDVSFCIDALKDALLLATPLIFNSDQGSQFTADTFTQILLAHNIKISMDSKGRALDNIFIERLWRSLKYENIYLNHYESVSDAFYGINNYFQFYNYERGHQSLKYYTPAQIHYRKGGAIAV